MKLLNLSLITLTISFCSITCLPQQSAKANELLTFSELVLTQTINHPEADRLLKQGLAEQQKETPNYQLSGQFLEKALILYQQSQNLRGETQALIAIGNNYEALKSYPKALAFYRQALAKSQQIPDLNLEAESLDNISYILEFMGEYEEAFELRKTILNIAQKLGDRELEMQQIIGLGEFYKQQKDYAKFIEAYQQVLVIAQELNDLMMAASANGYLGDTYLVQDNYEQAINAYQQAMNFAIAATELPDADVEECHCILNTAIERLHQTYWLIGEFEQAIEILHKSLVLFKDKPHEQVGLLLRIGYRYHSLGETGKALHSLNQALEIVRRSGDSLGEEMVQEIIDEVQKDFKQPKDQAENHI